MERTYKKREKGRIKKQIFFFFNRLGGHGAGKKKIWGAMLCQQLARKRKRKIKKIIAGAMTPPTTNVALPQIRHSPIIELSLENCWIKSLSTGWESPPIPSI
jgi:hypothetical protein